MSAHPQRREPAIVAVDRHAHRQVSVLFLTVAAHAQSGAVTRIDYGWGREPVDVVLNGASYLVRGTYGAPRHRVVGTYASVGEAVFAADAYDERAGGCGGAA